MFSGNYLKNSQYCKIKGAGTTIWQSPGTMYEQAANERRLFCGVHDQFSHIAALERFLYEFCHVFVIHAFLYGLDIIAV